MAPGQCGRFISINVFGRGSDLLANQKPVLHPLLSLQDNLLPIVVQYDVEGVKKPQLLDVLCHDFFIGLELRAFNVVGICIVELHPCFLNEVVEKRPLVRDILVCIQCRALASFAWGAPGMIHGMWRPMLRG